MLSDEAEHLSHVGGLKSDLYLPGEWLSSLIKFIVVALPDWRDDPRRPAKTAENSLTSQLCAHLNGLTRHTQGWDFLQFKREEPDETVAHRSLDIAVSPSGTMVWLKGREYTEYQILLPIECKRLPTPAGTNRDEREYLYSQFTTTGGVQRFKDGYHAAAHARAAMIGYVQSEDIPFGEIRLNKWVESLVHEAITGWSEGDKLVISGHDLAIGVASLRSKHTRKAGLEPIAIDHIWIEM